MDLHCEGCGKKIADAEDGTTINGKMVIRCRKCGFDNVITGEVSDLRNSAGYVSS